MFASRYDCEDIWRQFEDAVLRKPSCNVTSEDYHRMFYAVPQAWPCDRVSKSPGIAKTTVCSISRSDKSCFLAVFLS